MRDLPNNVSRETSQKLKIYGELLRKWSKKINLVSPSTLKDLEERHINDSLQIFGHADLSKTSWCDLGSGAGFPGLVNAIYLAEKNPSAEVTLIESDERKSTFLRTVLRETETAATIITSRIEDAPSQNADVITARALAPLPKLLGYALQHLAEGGVCYLHKGRDWKKELDDARRQWQFGYETHTSLVSPDSVIFEIRELKHA